MSKRDGVAYLHLQEENYKRNYNSRTSSVYQLKWGKLAVVSHLSYQSGVQMLNVGQQPCLQLF